MQERDTKVNGVPAGETLHKHWKHMWSAYQAKSVCEALAGEHLRISTDRLTISSFVRRVRYSQCCHRDTRGDIVSGRPMRERLCCHRKENPHGTINPWPSFQSLCGPRSLGAGAGQARPQVRI